MSMGKLIDEIRNAVNESNLSQYKIAKDTGLDKAQLSRLMSGERGLSIDSAEKLVDYLGLEISIRRRRKKR